MEEDVSTALGDEAMKYVVDIMKGLGYSYVKMLSMAHQHFIFRRNDELVLVIKTNRVLRNPRKVGINYDGAMLGIRKNYVEYELRLVCGKVIWIHRVGTHSDRKPVTLLRMLEAKSRDVIDFVTRNRTCIKRGFEVICHYPVKLTKEVWRYEHEGLERFI